MASPASSSGDSSNSSDSSHESHDAELVVANRTNAMESTRSPSANLMLRDAPLDPREEMLLEVDRFCVDMPNGADNRLLRSAYFRVQNFSLFRWIVEMKGNLCEPLDSHSLMCLLVSHPNGSMLAGVSNHMLQDLVSWLGPIPGGDPEQLIEDGDLSNMLDVSNQIMGLARPIVRSIVHRQLFRCCVQLMKNSLKQNICNVNSPSARVGSIRSETIRSCIPSHLVYACQNWITHLLCGHIGRDLQSELQDNGSIYNFFKVHFVHWVEALAYFNGVHRSIEMINELKDVVPFQNKLYGFLDDASKFVLKFHKIINYAPIQLYTCALFYAPKESEIHKIFHPPLVDFVRLLSCPEVRWGPNLVVLEPEEIGADGGVHGLLFSPSGNKLVSFSLHLVSNSLLQSVHVWSTVTGEHDLVLKESKCAVHAVKFSPDGSKLAMALGDGSALLWDALTKQATKITQHDRPVQDVDFSPDGALLATASEDRTVRIVDIGTGNIRRVLMHLGPISKVAFSPDGGKVAAVMGFVIQLWDVQTTSCLDIYEAPSEYITSVTFSPDSMNLMIVIKDIFIHKLGLATKTITKLEYHCLVPNEHEDCSPVAFHDGTKYVTYGKFTTMVWNTITGKLEFRFHSVGGPVTSVAFNSDGTKLASGSSYGEIVVWDISDPTFYPSTNGPIERIWEITFSPDGQKFAVASAEGYVSLWSTRHGVLIAYLKSHELAVRHVAFSPDGTLLASGATGDGVRIWDVESETCITGIFEDFQHDGWNLAFSPDGKLVASGPYAGSVIKILDVAFGGVAIELYYCPDDIHKLYFTADGTQLACEDLDHKITVFDLIEEAIVPHTPGPLNPNHWTSRFSPPPNDDLNWSVAHDNEWIYLNRKRFMWLPLMYRGRFWSASGNTIAIGGNGGPVSVFRVNSIKNWNLSG